MTFTKKTIQVLVIETSNESFLTLQNILYKSEAATFEITRFKSTEEIKNRLIEFSNDFDTILIGLNDVKNESLRSIKIVRSINPNLPIIVLTNTDAAESRKILARSGVQDCIKRDLISPELMERVLIHAREKRQMEYLVSMNSKLAVVGELAANLTHELNNPLAVVHGRLSQLKDFYKRNSHLEHQKVSKITDSMDRSLDQMIKIIKSNFRFSRGNNCDLISEVHLSKIVKEAIDLITYKADKTGVALSVEINTDSEPSVECYPTEISQVFVNLLNNACDAASELEERWVKVVITTTDIDVEVRVIDSGNAISSQQFRKFSDPFFTSKKLGKGSGLGLGISHKIIDKHSGLFDIDPNHKNACFLVKLPKKYETEINLGA